ncbi:MAG: hypothetical protein J6U93_00195 [Alistipes sp.]|nr:hypothetical protein [Alistipes sp.]
MKKSIPYLVATVLLLASCQPSESYLHFIFNITDNVKAVITINTSRHCRASMGEEEIGFLALNLSSEQEQFLRSVTLSSETQTIADRVDAGSANVIALQGVDRDITSTPTPFTIAMPPYAYAEGDLSIALEFESGTQTVSLPALTIERGMVLNVDCRL